MDRRCAGCSSVMPDVARFCPRCGRRAELPSAATPSKRKPFLPRLLMAGAIALMLFTFVLHFVARSQVVKPARIAWPQPVPGHGRIELSQQPEALFNREFSATEFTLNGVGLGDDREHIPGYLVRRTPSFYTARELRCEDGNTIHVFNGAVSRIVLEDPVLLSRLTKRDAHDNYRRGADEIIACFGPPDPQSYSSNKTGQYSVFTYASRGIMVRWDEAGQRLDAITLAPPSRRMRH